MFRLLEVLEEKLELYRRGWDIRFVRFCNLNLFLMIQCSGFEQCSFNLSAFVYKMFVNFLSILCERERVNLVLLASIIILGKEVEVVVPLRLSR